MDDLKQQMQHNFLHYASYVILDRAIPNVVDGLKPVQRRILHTLWRMDDGKLHKVANVCGQTMAFHPHGDAPIQEALVNLANKSYLLDRQGNFGNLSTGDPAAAARYIETRLSALAKETLFNPDLTQTVASYDGRNQEPVTLPSKIPLLLMQGAEGIAVGMSTRILPHNFTELLKACIDILQDKPIHILPDFISGGLMDASLYEKGRGKIKLRARIDSLDDKTLVITEICYGTTTESIIHSVDEAAKKGKIKIESIHDYTAEKVEIQIKLPRGQHARHVIDALYGFTECQVTLNSQIIVIKDQLPWETDVDEVLHLHVKNLQGYLKQELDIKLKRLNDKIYQKTLERLFIEERLYKKIEEIDDYKQIHKTMAQSFVPFKDLLKRAPEQEDFEKLLSIPIRRISRFDINKHKQEMEQIEKEVQKVTKDLKQIKKVTIDYLNDLLKRYGADFPRRTEIQTIEDIDKRAISIKKVKVGIDTKTGFFGLKVGGDQNIECTNFDKLLLIFQDRTYKVINLPDKELFDKNLLSWIGVADKKTPLTIVYRDDQHHCYAKRFIVDKFLVDKPYPYLEEGKELLLITAENPPGWIILDFKSKGKEKMDLKKVPLKKPSNKGIKLSTKAIKKVQFVE